MVINLDTKSSGQLLQRLITLTQSKVLIWKENRGASGPGCEWPDTTYLAKKDKTEFSLDHTTGELTIQVNGDENITKVKTMRLRSIVEKQVHPKLLQEQKRWMEYDRKNRDNTVNKIFQSLS